MTPEDILIATRTVWGEARSEPYEGKVAVMWVIRNRLEDNHRRENTLVGVVTEPYQFSCWLDNDPNKAKLEAVGPNDPMYLESMKAVVDVLTSPEESDPTKGSQHYHTKTILPRWAEDETPVYEVGHHLFYYDID